MYLVKSLVALILVSPGEPGVLLAVHADHVHHPLHPALHPGGALLAPAGPHHQGHYHILTIIAVINILNFWCGWFQNVPPS